MNAVPLVVPQAVRQVIAFREQLRLPPAPAVGTGPLPLTVAGRLFEQLAEELDDEAVGLHVGATSRFEDVPLGREVAGALTLGAALTSATGASSRYCTGQRLWLTCQGEQAWLQRRHSPALRRGRRQANDFALRILIDLVRRCAGPHWRPMELRLEGAPPGHAEQLASLAIGSTRFGSGADCLVFSRSLLALPLPRAGGRPAPATDGLLEVGFLDSARAAIRYLLELGEPTLPNLAEAAGTSVRSLQRHLAEAGVGFVRLVDEARFEEASRLLRDPSVRIIDVSVALGYTDAANFTRAFRRWAGVSPLEFRRSMLSLREAGVI